jgi:hypothetical protein
LEQPSIVVVVENQSINAICAYSYLEDRGSTYRETVQNLSQARVYDFQIAKGNLHKEV